METGDGLQGLQDVAPRVGAWIETLGKKKEIT